VQGLLVLSHWCTHFSTQVPKVLVDAFKVRYDSVHKISSNRIEFFNLFSDRLIDIVIYTVLHFIERNGQQELNISS